MGCGMMDDVGFVIWDVGFVIWDVGIGVEVLRIVGCVGLTVVDLLITNCSLLIDTGVGIEVTRLGVIGVVTGVD